MNKQEKIKNFDANSVGDINANMFGLPFTTAESETVLASKFFIFSCLVIVV